MILALLLQVATFQAYVEEARAKLGLDGPVTIEVYKDPVSFETQFGGAAPAFAWVPHHPPNKVYVWRNALRDATVEAQKVVAYHEACHQLLRRIEIDARTRAQKKLIHALQHQCTAEALGREFELILDKFNRNSIGSRLGTVLWWRERCR